MQCQHSHLRCDVQHAEPKVTFVFMKPLSLKTYKLGSLWKALVNQSYCLKVLCYKFPTLSWLCEEERSLIQNSLDSFRMIIRKKWTKKYKLQTCLLKQTQHKHTEPACCSRLKETLIIAGPRQTRTVLSSDLLELVNIWLSTAQTEPGHKVAKTLDHCWSDDTVRPWWLPVGASWLLRCSLGLANIRWTCCVCACCLTYCLSVNASENEKALFRSANLLLLQHDPIETCSRELFTKPLFLPTTLGHRTRQQKEKKPELLLLMIIYQQIR